MTQLQHSLAIATLLLSLLGRAQVYADIAEVGTSRAVPLATFAALVSTPEFESLPFDDAIRYFRSLIPLAPGLYDALESAAQQKAFTIAAATNTQIVKSIHGQLDRALADGLTLAEFQANAAELLDAAGVTARSPWYWETVYRTNLQTSYQVGRYKQMTDPDVMAARPYWRYVSARTPTSRPSHIERHGVVLPASDKFWQRWFPPNGFNCLCSVMTVSPILLERRGWQVADRAQLDSLHYQLPDKGFGQNPALDEEI